MLSLPQASLPLGVLLSEQSLFPLCPLLTLACSNKARLLRKADSKWEKKEARRPRPAPAHWRRRRWYPAWRSGSGAGRRTHGGGGRLEAPSPGPRRPDGVRGVGGEGECPGPGCVGAHGSAGARWSAPLGGRGCRSRPGLCSCRLWRRGYLVAPLLQPARV